MVCHPAVTRTIRVPAVCDKDNNVPPKIKQAGHCYVVSAGFAAITAYDAIAICSAFSL